MKVTVFSTKEFEKQFLVNSSKGKHELNFVSDALSINTVHLAEGSQAVSIFTNDDASAQVLNNLKDLNIHHIAIRAAGHDCVDLDRASELGISVANVPSYSPHSIAEHTVALMLALNRKIVQADNKVKNNNFLLDDLIGFNMHGKTVGIIGLGKIGKIVAKILNGFGCRLLVFDINEDISVQKELSFSYRSLDQICKESDIITLHLPLNNATKYIIDKSRIDLMKKGVMIVNTSRGGLINTKDMISALKEEKVSLLGLDVYEREKGLFFFDHSKSVLQDDDFARLTTFKNVIITGHQAFLTETALENISDTTIENIDSWETGKISANELTRNKLSLV